MIVAGGYSAWVILCVVMTVFHIGDGGTAAHLALVFTGPPAAILSLYLPNGSLIGVSAAGVLGLAQWVAIAELTSRWSSRPKAGRGA
jgi:hypothetical protein